jgi:glycosyltransferase involved in cell wall biosynthesis
MIGTPSRKDASGSDAGRERAPLASVGGTLGRPDVSVIAPLYNEEDSVAPLVDAIEEVFRESPAHYEIVLVDDGSRDHTYARAKGLAESRPHLKLIRFRRNYGQTPAMAAGIDHALGRVLVTMDGDLQNDPRDIVHLVEEIDKGADIAVGWRFNRQDKLITRKIPSRIANWLIGKVTGVPIKDNGCSLKAYRAEMIKRIPLYSEMHRFIPAMSSIAGARVVEIKVRHRARQFGHSKYGLSRIYRVLFDLLSIKTIISFASRPMRGFGALASPFLILAAVFLALTVRRAMLAPDSTLIVLAGLAIICTAGASFVLVCGALAELVYRTGNVRPVDFSSLTAIEEA